LSETPEDPIQELDTVPLSSRIPDLDLVRYRLAAGYYDRLEVLEMVAQKMLTRCPERTDAER
jgi:hypothetical protein